MQYLPKYDRFFIFSAIGIFFVIDIYNQQNDELKIKFSPKYKDLGK